MVCGSALGLIGSVENLFGKEISLLLTLFFVSIGFMLAVRLRCPNCNFRLSKKFPVGALILLFFAKDSCPQCGEKIP